MPCARSKRRSGNSTGAGCRYDDTWTRRIRQHSSVSPRGRSRPKTVYCRVLLLPLTGPCLILIVAASPHALPDICWRARRFAPALAKEKTCRTGARGRPESVAGLTVVNVSSRKFSDHDRVHNEQRENGHERQYFAAEHYRCARLRTQHWCGERRRCRQCGSLANLLILAEAGWRTVQHLALSVFGQVKGCCRNEVKAGRRHRWYWARAPVYLPGPVSPKASGSDYAL